MRRLRFVKAGEQPVDRPDRSLGAQVDPREASRRTKPASVRRGFERPNDGGTHGDDASAAGARPFDRLHRRRGHFERFGEDRHRSGGEVPEFETGHARVQHDRCELHPRRPKAVDEARSERSGRARHFRAARNTGERCLVGLERELSRSVAVPDRLTAPLHRLLEIPVRAKKDKARNARKSGDEGAGDTPDLDSGVRVERERSGARGPPPRLTDPEPGAVGGREVDTKVADLRSRGQTRGKRCAFVHDEQVARTEQVDEVRKDVFPLLVGGTHEKTDAVPFHPTLLWGPVRPGADSHGKRGRRCHHSGTSQRSAWARKRWPEVLAGSWFRSHAQNGRVTSGDGRSEMSSPG